MVEAVQYARHIMTHMNDYVDNMIACKEDRCSYYFYDIDGKYRYCESCRSKDMC